MTMQRIYAPGVDRIDNLEAKGDMLPVPDDGAYDPSRGPGGVFARTLQGFTPKYAINRGSREFQHKNTLARLYMQVPTNERTLFDSSISDPILRSSIVPQLIGDATAQVTDTGYMDFFIQNISCGLQEKMQVVETLSDNYVVYFFGYNAPQWNYQGTLVNTVQDDQLTSWLRMYMQLTRGTQLARRGKVISLRYDSFVVTGTLFNMSWQHNAQNEIGVPFSFSLLLKRLFIVRSTLGWKPTTPNAAASDPLLAVSSGSKMPRQENAPVAVGRASGTPTPPTSTATANARTISLPASGHYRSTDTTASVGPSIPAGAQVTILGPGTSIRTNPDGSTSRTYQVQVTGQSRPGYMFFTDAQVHAAAQDHAPSSGPSSTAQATASFDGGSPHAEGLAQPISGVRPADAPPPTTDTPEPPPPAADRVPPQARGAMR
jgi:hypothetical protein